MTEAVASQIQFRAPSTFAPRAGADDVRRQLEDFELLVEALLEQYEAAKRESERLKRENAELRREIEKREGE